MQPFAGRAAHWGSFFFFFTFPSVPFPALKTKIKKTQKTRRILEGLVEEKNSQNTLYEKEKVEKKEQKL